MQTTFIVQHTFLLAVNDTLNLIFCCRLQHEMSLCNDNAERQRELGDKLSQQHELMESERKASFLSI